MNFRIFHGFQWDIRYANLPLYLRKKNNGQIPPPSTGSKPNGVIKTHRSWLFVLNGNYENNLSGAGNWCQVWGFMVVRALPLPR